MSNKIKLRRKRRQLRKIKRRIYKSSKLTKIDMDRIIDLTVLEYMKPSVVDFLCGNEEKYLKNMEIWRQRKQELLYRNK